MDPNVFKDKYKIKKININYLKTKTILTVIDTSGGKHVKEYKKGASAVELITKEANKYKRWKNETIRTKKKTEPKLKRQPSTKRVGKLVGSGDTKSQEQKKRPVKNKTRTKKK